MGNKCLAIKKDIVEYYSPDGFLWIGDHFMDISSKTKCSKCGLGNCFICKCCCYCDCCCVKYEGKKNITCISSRCCNKIETVYRKVLCDECVENKKDCNQDYLDLVFNDDDDDDDDDFDII